MDKQKINVFFVQIFLAEWHFPAKMKGVLKTSPLHGSTHQIFFERNSLIIAHFFSIFFTKSMHWMLAIWVHFTSKMRTYFTRCIEYGSFLLRTLHYHIPINGQFIISWDSPIWDLHNSIQLPHTLPSGPLPSCTGCFTTKYIK